MTIEIEEIVNGKIEPAFSENNVPLCLFSSNDYAPYCGVLVQSVVENSTPEHNYDIVILERNISDNNKRLMLSLIEKHCNISIRFINVAKLSKELTVSVHGHFTLDNCIKIYLLSPLFSKYDKFVATDSDLVFNRDLAELYETGVENYYMAAVDDVIMKKLVAVNHISGANGKAPKMYAGEYIADYLGMKTSDVYYNTGVVVFNLKLCRQDGIFEKAIELLNTKHYWFLEQDVLNELCWEKSSKLDMRWNVSGGNSDIEGVKSEIPNELSLEYNNALNDYYIMHFPGGHKPWNEPMLPYSERFFSIARHSVWYEQILFHMSGRYSVRVARDTVNKSKAVSNVKAKDRFKRMLMLFPNLVLPKGTKRRAWVKSLVFRLKDKRLMQERKKMLKRIHKMYRNRLKKGSEYYDNYWELNALKNSHKGERCFIIGNGPSLTISDLEKLSGEITFGMNSIYKIFEQTNWRPTYYVSNDIMLNYKMKAPVESRKRDLTECIGRYKFEKCFISSSDFNSELNLISKSKILYLPTEDYLYQILQPRFPKFHNDCSKKCQAFGTTAYLAYQIAVYMGFSKIYLLGTDCSYSGEKRHIYEESKEENSLYSNKRIASSLEYALLRGFAAIKNHDDRNENVGVYNVSRGGKLELFPRQNLDDIL